MKTAFELAMERLNKASPTEPLTDELKRQLAELDSIYIAKTAERELFLRDEISGAEAAGDYEAMAQLQKQLNSERQVLRAECEAKKEALRKSSPSNNK
jgi:hypothetical protein